MDVTISPTSPEEYFSEFEDLVKENLSSFDAVSTHKVIEGCLVMEIVFYPQNDEDMKKSDSIFLQLVSTLRKTSLEVNASISEIGYYQSQLSEGKRKYKIESGSIFYPRLLRPMKKPRINPVYGHFSGGWIGGHSNKKKILSLTDGKNLWLSKFTFIGGKLSTKWGGVSQSMYGWKTPDSVYIARIKNFDAITENIDNNVDYNDPGYVIDDAAVEDAGDVLIVKNPSKVLASTKLKRVNFSDLTPIFDDFGEIIDVIEK